MKYAIILPDGAADEPLRRADQRANGAGSGPDTPHMDEVARDRATGYGSLVTVPEGFLPGSDVATLSVLGCDPDEVYYAGRAPLEAAARDIPVGPRDIVFRCNLVTVQRRAACTTSRPVISPRPTRLRSIGALNTLFARRAGRLLSWACSTAT
jgi:2,3-bisphosphoglycerate-independent phosphoglycerate mutase